MTVTPAWCSCAALCLPTGIRLLERRHDPLRHPSTTDWRKKVLRIRAYFEKPAECSIYERPY